MEFISKEKIVELSNPGVVSRQLLNPENSSSERVTITEVHLEIGACQPRHTHDASEQIWYATKGTGKLLLADKQDYLPFLDASKKHYWILKKVIWNGTLNEKRGHNILKMSKWHLRTTTYGCIMNEKRGHNILKMS